MNIITSKMMTDMQNKLMDSLPPEFQDFAYEVESGNSMVVQFLLTENPTAKQLSLLKSTAIHCIDSYIPIGDEVPTWVAEVRVGGKRVGDLAVGGTRVDTFEGSTVKYGLLIN